MEPVHELVGYAESAIVEDEALLAAREASDDLGVVAITPGVGATLAVFAAATNAKSVVEIGTGAGISGLWLLSGMRADGVLTTIDSEPEFQAAARVAFARAGAAGARARLINGHAQEVLPRLTDGAYDLMFVDGEISDQPQFVAEATRLLRPGGVLIVHGGLPGGGPAQDPTLPGMPNDAQAAREAAQIVADDEAFLPVVIPLGAGLLAAVKAPA